MIVYLLGLISQTIAEYLCLEKIDLPKQSMNFIT